MRGNLLVLFCGACAIFSFSPYHQWWVLCVITAILYLSLHNLSVRQAAWRGFFFGVGFFGTGVSWVYVSIHLFGNASPILAGGLTFLFVIALAAVFFLLWCSIYQWLIKRHKNSALAPLLFTSCWVLGEFFRSWFATGFPWLLSGYTLIDTPASGLAPIIGVYGLSFILTLISVSFAQLIKTPRKLSVSFVLAFTVLASLTAIPFQHIKWTYPKGNNLTFSAVQGNIPQQAKWDQAYLEKIVHTYLRLSKRNEHKDLIIWPENAIPIIYQNNPELISSLNEQALSHNNALVFGMPWQEQGKIYNAVLAIGKGQGHYLKQKLVPFGEYVPMESWLRGLISFFDLPMSEFSSGKSNQQLISVKGYPVAVYICYEAVYPDFSAKLARRSAFIITISDDSWFGKSAGPWQHFQMVRMRALETGRYLINDTNNSHTSLISPEGKVLKQIPSFHAGALHGSITPMAGETPFMRYGSTPIFILCLALIVISRLKRKNN